MPEDSSQVAKFRREGSGGRGATAVASNFGPRSPLRLPPGSAFCCDWPPSVYDAAKAARALSRAARRRPKVREEPWVKRDGGKPCLDCGHEPPDDFDSFVAWAVEEDESVIAGDDLERGLDVFVGDQALGLVDPDLGESAERRVTRFGQQ